MDFQIKYLINVPFPENKKNFFEYDEFNKKLIPKIFASFSNGLNKLVIKIFIFIEISIIDSLSKIFIII